MPLLIGATILLIASHLLPSAPGVRESLIARLGRGGFYAWYSLLSLLALGFVLWAYRAAEVGPLLYAPSAVACLIALAGMLLTAFLLVGRLTTRPAREAPVGIYRVSAVPGSLAVMIWAVVHLLNRGEGRLVVVFGGLALLALAALIKNLHLAAPACRRVGWLPFLAALRGRERIVWAEIGWWRLCLAVLSYLALLLLHPVVIGPDPLTRLL
jgi:uncharacterized membrane protein